MIKEFTILKCESMNPKIPFKFLCMSNPKRNRLEGMFEKNKVYHDLKEPETNDERDLRLWQEIYRSFFLEDDFQNVLAKVSKSLRQSFSEEKGKRLAKELEISQNDEGPDAATTMFIRCVRTGIFGIETSRVAACIFNWIMTKNCYLPIIFYHQSLSALAQFADARMERDDLEGMMTGLIPVSVRYNTKHRDYSPDELASELSEMGERLKADHGVRHLWMTGSYVNGLFNEYSDLDVVVDVNAEGLEHPELERFLEQSLSIPVDVIDSRDIFCESKDIRRFRRRIF
jgi:predicted nucleotidyltransferase